MLLPRIIPCLDVHHGRTVKGVQFTELIDSGDPVQLALQYAADGADELVWLEISATLEPQPLPLKSIAKLRQGLKIPLTVGGGVRAIGDTEELLQWGADKVSINSAALKDPALITKVARRWGSQCMVVAVDVRSTEQGFQVFSHGGRRPTGRELGEWLHEAQERGAGEFLLTSITRDGGQYGYDLAMLDYARTFTQRPIIASGGAGSADHLAAALDRGHTALLLASILHQRSTSISNLKYQLRQRGFRTREQTR